MGPEQTQRADEVWARIIGLFGGDAVKRKYGPAMPTEWRAIIAKLNTVELERGMRRLVHSGRDQVPSLPAFVRLCRTIGHDDAIPDDPPQATVAQLTRDGWNGDAWDIAANQHMLKHVIRRTVERRAPYRVTDIDALLAAKKLWAQDMRDLAVNGEVPVEMQKQLWLEYLDGAERQIAQSAVA